MKKRELESALRTVVDPALRAQAFTYSARWRRGWYRDVRAGQSVGVWFQVAPTTATYLLDGSARDALESVRCDVGFGPPGRYMYNVAGLENTMRTPLQFLDPAQRQALATDALQRVSGNAREAGVDVTAEHRELIALTAGSDDMFFPVDGAATLRAWWDAIRPAVILAVAATIDEVHATHAEP